MDFKLILLAAGLAFAGCDAIKKTAEGAADSAEKVWKGKHTLSLTFQTHRPYCGGARPTEEQVLGSTEPISNQVFYIYKDDRPATATQMIKVTTDASGFFKIDLKAGTYSVISADKILTLEEFIAKKKIIDQFYSYSADSCFEEWRNTPDFTMKITSNETETVTIDEKCFTGDNPCMEYTGPYPP